MPGPASNRPTAAAHAAQYPGPRVHGAIQAEPGELLPLSRRPRAAHLDEPQVGAIPADGREDIEEHVDPLPWDATADVEQERAIVRRGRPGCEFCGHPIGDVYQPRRVDQAMPLQLTTHFRGAVEDDGRLLQSPQRAPGQGAEPARAAVPAG